MRFKAHHNLDRRKLPLSRLINLTTLTHQLIYNKIKPNSNNLLYLNKIIQKHIVNNQPERNLVKTMEDQHKQYTHYIQQKHSKAY